jgi:hypothetical protein
MLFSNISDLKTYVGGGANLSVELDSLTPIMHMTAIRHIIPYLGETTWYYLLTQYATETPEAEATALLPYVQRPLALLTLYEYVSVGSVQLSEAGMMRVETENMKSAYKYQENQYRDWMLHNGYEALEEMIKFLMANRGDYTDWDGSAAFRRCFSATVYYAADLRDLYAKYVSRYTYEIIRPALLDVEQFAIIPMIGEAQHTRLIEGIQAEDLTADESAMLQIIQRAVAHLAVMEAAARHWVRFDGYNVVQTERSGDQGSENSMSATPAGLALKMRSEELSGNRYIAQLRKFLTAQAEGAFPLYDAYCAELAEAAEETAESDIENPELYTDRVLYYNPPTPTKGIIRF